MNRRQRRAAEAQNKGHIRISIAVPDKKRAARAAQIMKFIEDRWPTKGEHEIDDIAYTLFSLSASYVALLPAGSHRDAIVAEAPAVFQQLVTRAIARGIEADRMEESLGGITPEKLKAMGSTTL